MCVSVYWLSEPALLYSFWRFTSKGSNYSLPFPHCKWFLPEYRVVKPLFLLFKGNSSWIYVENWMIYLVFFAWSVSPHGTIEISLTTQSPSVDHAFNEIPNHRTIAVKLINLSHLCTYCCGVSCSVSFFFQIQTKNHGRMQDWIFKMK